MAPTTNEQIYDALIRRQVFVVRFSNQLSAGAVKALKATDTELEKLVLYYSRKLSGKSLTSKAARELLKTMKAEVSALRYSAWDGISKALQKELKGYAAVEAEHVSKVIREALPVIVNTTPVPAARIAEVIQHTAWEGATLAEHIKTAAASDVDRIVKRVRIGAGRQQSLDEIVRTVMGSSLQNYRDGAVSKAWHGAETLAYSATTSAQNEATTLVAEANPWLITKEVFRATLDGRTTPICIKNSNKVFKVGEGPQPPLHYRCRSRRVPYISDDSLGPQPFDPSTEKTLVAEYAEINGLGKVGSRAALPYGTKGDFDAWARKRRRELIGQVPDTVDYPEWFSKQSAAFQDEELGPARGKIYRANNLPLDKYINRKGQYYTLDELEARSLSATPTPRKRGGGSSGGGSATPAPKPIVPKPPKTDFTDADDDLLNDLGVDENYLGDIQKKDTQELAELVKNQPAGQNWTRADFAKQRALQSYPTGTGTWAMQESELTLEDLKSLTDDQRIQLQHFREIAPSGGISKVEWKNVFGSEYKPDPLAMVQKAEKQTMQSWVNADLNPKWNIADYAKEGAVNQTLTPELFDWAQNDLGITYAQIETLSTDQKIQLGYFYSNRTKGFKTSEFEDVIGLYAKSDTSEIKVDPAKVKAAAMPYKTEYNTGESYPSREQQRSDYDAYERRQRLLRGEPPIVEPVSGRDDLTERQTTLLKQYQGTSYKTHNEVLRHREKYDTETIVRSEQFVEGIEEAISKYAVKDDVVLYRGVDHADLYKALDENSVGKVLQAGSLQSTTWSEDTARGFARFSGGFIPNDKSSMLININVKSGTNALYVSDITSGLRSEQEFLLSSKGQYIVREVRTEKYRSVGFLDSGKRVGQDIEYKILELDYVKP